jgi:hypothetical protein
MESKYQEGAFQLRADCQEAKKLLKIKKPIIPHREYGLANAARSEAGAWYN